MSDVYDQIEAEIANETVVTSGAEVAPRAMAGGVLAGVLRGLVGSGLKLSSALAWLPVILQLIQELGPQITAIIKRIQDAIKDGRTPQTFHAA